jgi:hypothetical protein
MGKENYAAGIGDQGLAPVKYATLVFFERFNGVKDQGLMRANKLMAHELIG